MQCHLSWDTYKKNICNGFSNMQQREEFVDMTLAADGHLVKVHRNLVALASPYIKQMITSASCQHPVIFLNNVSNEVLCYILEYIYTGEVGLPVEKINSFMEAAKALRISGLESVVYPGYERKSEMAHENRNEQKTPHIKKSMNRNISLKNTDPSLMRQLMVQNGPINENDLPDTANEIVYSDNNIVITADKIHNNHDLVNITDEKVHNYIDLVDITDDIHIDNDVVDTTNGVDRVQEENCNFPNIMDVQTIAVDLESKNENEWNNSIPTINIGTKTHSSHFYNYNLEIQRLSGEKHNLTDSMNIKDNLENISINNYNQSISTLEDVDINQNPPDNINIQDNLENTTINYNQNISTHDDIDMQAHEVEPATVTNNEDKTEYPRISIKIDKVMAHGGHFNLETEVISTLPGTIANPPLYALSNKGSMQLILNRYMYYLHHTSQGGRKRRWRCIDYRRQKCKAFIDTDNEIIMKRTFEHCHTFHDYKILKTGQRKRMYTSIKQVSCTEENSEKKNEEPPNYRE